jgi:hypothetical protein
MMTKNGKTEVIEDGTPGCPYIRHLEVHAACDRFLAARGIITEPTFRKSAWLYGHDTPAKSRRSA